VPAREPLQLLADREKGRRAVAGVDVGCARQAQRLLS
jgi:hypothetical protein